MSKGLDFTKHLKLLRQREKVMTRLAIALAAVIGASTLTATEAEAKGPGGSKGSSGSKGMSQSWHQIVPLFVIGFVIMACIRSLGDVGAADGSAAFGFVSRTRWDSVCKTVART